MRLECTIGNLTRILVLQCSALYDKNIEKMQRLLPKSKPVPFLLLLTQIGGKYIYVIPSYDIILLKDSFYFNFRI